jgi:hypothetical protein
MNGIALTVLISQLPKLFGFSIDSDGPLRDLWQIAESSLNGKTNGATLMIGAGTLAVILLLRRYRRVPGILIAVIGATVVVGLFDLGQTAGVKVLGSLPQGLPGFTLPWISLADVQGIIIGGCAVALVSARQNAVRPLRRASLALHSSRGPFNKVPDPSARRFPALLRLQPECEHHERPSPEADFGAETRGEGPGRRGPPFPPDQEA